MFTAHRWPLRENLSSQCSSKHFKTNPGDSQTNSLKLSCEWVFSIFVHTLSAVLAILAQTSSGKLNFWARLSVVDVALPPTLNAREELKLKKYHKASRRILKMYLLNKNMSLICDKSVTNQNLAFLSYWYRKKRLQMHFLTGIVS